MLEPFADDIWLADGPVVDGAAGFRFPTRMALLRLPDGGLFAWSPVALSDDLRAAVEALGPVRRIAPPNSLHHLFLPDWIAAFPEAKVHAPPGLRAKRPDIAFDADLGDAPDPDWAGVIDQAVIRGNRITTEVVFLHAPSGTALFADLLQQLPRDWFSGWRAAVARLDLMTGTEPAVPRKFRLAFRDKAAARASVAEVLGWPVAKVVIAHGPPVEAEGAALLRRAFGWLTD